MARRKAQRASSGAPGLRNGPGIGPSLNPLSLAQQSPLGLFIDIEVARKAYEEGSAWKRWHADAEAQALWSAPVQPRRRNGAGPPSV
jgi:hypothetical protein